MTGAGLAAACGIGAFLCMWRAVAVWKKVAAAKDRQIAWHQREIVAKDGTIRTQAAHIALLKGVIDEQNKRDYPIKEER